MGVEFTRNREFKTITLSQSKYIKEVFKLLYIEDCKPIGIPLVANLKLIKLIDIEYAQEEPEMQGILEKAIVDLLMYTMMDTRIDLAFVVSVVSQHMAKLGPLHWTTINRIMRYLKGSLDPKLYLGGDNVTLHRYCKADWTRDAND